MKDGKGKMEDEVRTMKQRWKAKSRTLKEEAKVGKREGRKEEGQKERTQKYERTWTPPMRKRERARGMGG
jgi:hypothetical protein